MVNTNLSVVKLRLKLYVPCSTKKTTTIEGVLYLDFQTYPEMLTRDQTPTALSDDAYAEEKLFNPMEIYDDA